MNYEIIDSFVDDMNESAGRVGDTSIYLFNRFRNGIGMVFILVTTVAIAFIVAEFVRKFNIINFFGLNMYWIAMIIGLGSGLYISYWAETAKISTIKGAVFSEKSNKFYQLLATCAIITVLIIINTNGIQKIADFSFRYMDDELQNSYIVKLKEKKMQNHIDLSNSTLTKGKSRAAEMILSSREDLVKAKENEIKAIKNSFDAWVQGRNRHKYRTLISNKKIDIATKITNIENKYSNKISKLDWKISQVEKRVSNNMATLVAQKAKQLKDTDNAVKELENYYEAKSTENQKAIDEYKGIGLIIAIAGEIVDGVLAFLLFILVKSNPNTNGTPRVDRNTRALKPRVVASPREVHTVSDLVKKSNRTPNKKESL